MGYHFCFLEIVNRCSLEGDVSTEINQFGNIINCCIIRNREIFSHGTYRFSRWSFQRNMRDSLIRPFLCSDQIDQNNLGRVIEPKQASYKDALIECSKRASKIASVSEMEKYWKYTHKNQVVDDSQACSYHFCSYFWTSNKPINNSLRDPRRLLICAKKFERRTDGRQTGNLGPNES